MSARNQLMSADSPDNELPASKRPRMLAKACESCKSKKSRCDSARPQCDNCRRKGTTCVYREKGQPGVRPGYKKDVDQRLALLESDVGGIYESLQEVLKHIRTTGSAANSASNLSDKEMHSTVNINRNGNENISAADTQVVNSESPLFQRSRLLPDVGDYAPSLLPEHQLTTSIDNTDVDNTTTGHNGLPPNEILHELIDLFFEYVNPWAQLFHKPNFLASAFLPDRQLILHGIVVVSFRFWRKSVPTSATRDMYSKRSREHILLKTSDCCSLPATQALALSAIDAIGQGTGPRTWNTMSMLVAASRHLGLAKTHPSELSDTVEATTPLVRTEDLDDDDLELSNIDAEEKRRLFWVIYTLDRFSSASHGQPGGIDPKIINLPYPTSNDDSRFPGSMAPTEWFQLAAPALSHAHCGAHKMWHHNLDLLAMMDRSNQFLIQPVNLSIPAHCQEWQNNFRRIENALSTWFDGLPRDMKAQPILICNHFEPMQFMVLATFHLIAIRMYTVAAFPGTTSPYLRPSSSARVRCRRAIKEIACLTTSLQQNELNILGPMFAFIIWVAARSLIILWTSGYENISYMAIPADLQSLLDGLRLMSTFWPCAQRYCNLINLVLDTKNEEGNSTLSIFNDTRRTAHGLHHRLKTVLTKSATEVDPNHPFDFFDVPGLELGDLTAPWMGAFETKDHGEWL